MADSAVRIGLVLPDVMGTYGDGGNAVVLRQRLRLRGIPAEIVETRGLKQVTDTGAISKAVDDIIAGNPDKVEQVKAKPTMLGWFVGQVMKSTGGKANPQAVSDLLKEKLGI